MDRLFCVSLNIDIIIPGDEMKRGKGWNDANKE